jgi:hypothetical protein
MIKHLFEKFTNANKLVQGAIFGATVTAIIFFVIFMFWINFWLGIACIIFGLATAWYVEEAEKRYRG